MFIMGFFSQTNLTLTSMVPVHCKEIRYLPKHIVMPVVPGKSYCVSVRFWDKLQPKESNYSQPECAVIPGIFSKGTRHALHWLFSAGANIMSPMENSLSAAS